MRRATLVAVRRRQSHDLTGEDLSRLFRQRSPQLLAYLTRLTLDRDVALDLLAETFAQAFASRRQFRGESADDALPWLYAIARHQAARLYRRGRAEQRAMRKLGIQTPVWEEGDYERVEELASVVTLRDLLDRALRALPTDQQDALQRHILDDVPYAEIAAELGISEQTVRARVSRGLRALADDIRADVVEAGGWP